MLLVACYPLREGHAFMSNNCASTHFHACFPAVILSSDTPRAGRRSAGTVKRGGRMWEAACQMEGVPRKALAMKCGRMLLITEPRLQKPDKKPD